MCPRDTGPVLLVRTGILVHISRIIVSLFHQTISVIDLSID